MGKVPKLRFKEFSGEYIEYKLSQLMKRYSEKNSDNEFSIEDILSLSSIHGIVDRKELLEDTYNKVNHTNYLKTRLNDFVYGKSISASCPYGLFKVNKCRDGLLSTLYFTFKTFDNVSAKYLDKYFSHLNRANNFLKKYVLVGDRYITADSNYILSGEIFIPTINEQNKIVSFLTFIDNKIEQFMKKEKLIQQYKKGIIQKLFNQKIRFKDNDGGEFKEWEEKKLGDLTKINQGLQIAISERFTNEVENSYFYITNEFLKENSDKKYFIKNPPESVICDEDDILMTRTGNTGQVVTDVKGAFHNNFFKIKYFDNFNKKFLVYYLRLNITQNMIMRYAGTSTIPDLNHSDFYRLKIQLPSLEEQNKIANFLSSIDDKIEQVQKQLKQTKRV